MVLTGLAQARAGLRAPPSPATASPLSSFTPSLPTSATPHSPFRPRSYFALSVASVHLSAGRYDDAMQLYRSLEAELAKLPSDHPNVALLASCRGYALHCMGQEREAFEQYVQVRAIQCC